MATLSQSESEKQQYIDPDTHREVTLWTDPDLNNIGFYYHQNAFDSKRNLVYFVSNRTGDWQIWRVHLSDGHLEQVSNFEELGKARPGDLHTQSSQNYWVYVSKRNDQIYLGGNCRIGVIDPDTLECRILMDTCPKNPHPDNRYYRDAYLFPSCDDRWVYTYGVEASDAEMQAGQALTNAIGRTQCRDGDDPSWNGMINAPRGMNHSLVLNVIQRVEVATGRVEELWRGFWGLQHVEASPVDPDLITFCWASTLRGKPKYFLLRAGHEPQTLIRDEPNFVAFHDFWHPDGTRWFTHSCENLEPTESYSPIPGKMRFSLCDINIHEFEQTGNTYINRWYESAGESSVHMHINIAPDGSFLVGDGQPDTPFITRLDWQDNITLKATPLCRAAYPTKRYFGIECHPNAQVSPDMKFCFFTTHQGKGSALASVLVHG